MMDLNKEDFIGTLKGANEQHDYDATYVVDAPIYEDERNDYAVVIAWCQDSKDEPWTLQAKFACQSKNSVMSDYDWDWEFPLTENDEYDYNEITIDLKNKTPEHYYDYFNKIYKSYQVED